MFISIIENQSGESRLLRRLSPTESLCLRDHVKAWAAREYDGYTVALSFSESGSHIPNGCGQYQAEIRDTKAESGSCWESEPFYLDVA